MYRYFLHEISDWPLDGACNDAPFGPDADGMYLATLDAGDSPCAAYALWLVELTPDGARAWAAALAAAEVDGGVQ